MNPPCKDCSNRAVGCHSNCGRYLVFRSWCDKQMRKRHAEQMLKSYVIDSMVHTTEINRKNHGHSYAIRNS